MDSDEFKGSICTFLVFGSLAIESPGREYENTMFPPQPFESPEGNHQSLPNAQVWSPNHARVAGGRESAGQEARSPAPVCRRLPSCGAGIVPTRGSSAARRTALLFALPAMLFDSPGCVGSMHPPGRTDALNHVIAHWVGRFLERQGLREGDAEMNNLTVNTEFEDSAAQLPGHSIRYRIASGHRRDTRCSPFGYCRSAIQKILDT